MPKELRAESTVVRPTPATGDEISKMLMIHHDVSEQLVDDGKCGGDAFLDGFEGALAFAIDHPDEAKLVLAQIDNRNRLASLTAEENITARAEIMDGLASVARGELTTEQALTSLDQPANVSTDWIN